jgi:anaerobic magnesium-protoporphyrin IX monomethyl ester cyclase
MHQSYLLTGHRRNTEGNIHVSKIVLIRPPMILSQFSLSTSTTPPIAIAYLSGTLRANGYDVQTIDAIGEDIERLTPMPGTVGLALGLPVDQIIERIDADATIIGYSAMFSCSWTWDKKILEGIRSRFPQALIVIGGEHATACTEYVLRDCRAVDLCARGEGEDTLLEIVTAHQDGKVPAILDGVASLENGSVRINPPRARIRDIDNIPEPDWTDLPLEAYMKGGYGHGVNLGRSMPLMATRGCPFQCTFCSSPGMWTTRWQARSPQIVFDEMVKYIEKYNAQNFDLYDLTAIIKKDWIMEFTDIILASDYRFTWQLPSGTRSEALDADVIDRLWRSGCRNMNYAPESGSDEVLKRIKKKVSLPKLVESMKAAIKHDLNVKINMIFAFPEDTWRHMFANFAFGIKCAWLGVNDSSFIPYVPYPGSELYDQLAAQNKIEPMSDAYFDSLIPFSDLAFAKSYNPLLKDRHLVWIRYLYFAVFYGTMFLRRPSRAFAIISNMFSGKQASRGEQILRNFIARKKQLRSAEP